MCGIHIYIYIYIYIYIIASGKIYVLPSMCLCPDLGYYMQKVTLLQVYVILHLYF